MTWRPATRQAAVYALAGALATGGYYLLSGDAQAIWYEVIGASAVAAMWLGVRGRTGSDRLAWQLFAIGMMGQVAGDVEIESAEFAGTCVRVTPPAAEPAFPFA